MLSVYVMDLLTRQNCVLNAERSPDIPVRYLLGYRDLLWLFVFQELNFFATLLADHQNIIFISESALSNE